LSWTITPTRSETNMGTKERWRIFGALGVLLSLSSQPLWAAAAIVPSTSEAQCRALQAADLSQLQDAPTQVTEIQLTEAQDGVPGYCRVRGYVAPQIGFEIRLPTSQWNGKFIEVGCGGTCGVVNASDCSVPLRKGYACIASDMGHEGSGALWAYNNLQAHLDFGFRAAHVTALAGKAITERYYSQAPRKSYFVGCSTGGRQGMIEAQRFPWDFDGIAAGAPPLNLAAMTQMWLSLAVLDKDGRSVLSPTAVQLLHKAVLAQCASRDGMKNGVLGNPLACKFDPGVLSCKSDQRGECLTQVQVDAVRKLYAGPRSTGGNNVYATAGGEVPGSELDWVNVYFSSDGRPGFLYEGISELFRYMVYAPGAGPQWNPKDLDFDRDYARLGTFQSFESAANPDLRQFQRAGGKLLFYQGWNDPLEVPREAIDYYETAEKVGGGRTETQKFLRLFVVPGMGHCGGGEGASEIDYLSYLEAWVEKGQAPDKMIGAHVDTDQFMKTHDSNSESFAAEFEKFRTDPHNISFTRPVYPYPTRAVYKGFGDPSEAANFIPAN
jgi:Tannase and feruloyl esterase